MGTKGWEVKGISCTQAVRRSDKIRIILFMDIFYRVSHKIVNFSMEIASRKYISGLLNYAILCRLRVYELQDIYDN